MRYMTILVCLLGLSIAAFAAPKPRYLRVMVSGEKEAANPVCEGSLWFDITQEQNYSGVYYITGSSCGITAETSRYQSSDLKFELVFNLLLSINDGGAWLAGATRALNYADNVQPGRAERTSIEKALPIGQEELVCSHKLPDGRQIYLKVELRTELPNDCADCGQSAVVLRSAYLKNGVKVSSGSSGRKFLTEAMEFQSGVGDIGNAADASEMKYVVMISMPGALKALKERTECKITFQRAYQIRSRGGSGGEGESSVNYTSRNVKDIVLEPGKELRLVFPPDTPAVEGYAIEDTLIILPRK
jgi:hypothetical protein